MHILKKNQGWLFGEGMASSMQSHLSEVLGTGYTEIVCAVLTLLEYTESLTRGSFHENAQFYYRYMYRMYRYMYRMYRTKQFSINDVHAKSKRKFRNYK